MEDMIHVKVLPFGPATDILGREPIVYGLIPPATLSSLTELLRLKYPTLAAIGVGLRYAINGDYAQSDALLNEGDEVAVIPPVSGGQDQSSERVRLSTEVIDMSALVAAVENPACGAIATFAGVVREEIEQGRRLEALEYSAYEVMAVQQMRSLRTHALRRFAIHDAAIVHRLGRLGIGETSVAIAVSAPHRGDAFDACRWIIDTLKADMPIWKMEIWSTGDATWSGVDQVSEAVE